MNKKLLFLEAIKDNKYSKFIKKMPDVEFIEDTWIVKGLKLEPPVTNKKLFGKYEFDIADSICEFKKLKIENIEFHNCDFNWGQWVVCSFKKVKFYNCKLSYAKFWNSNFEDVEFHGVNFTETLMGADLEGGSGMYVNTVFIECNLKKTMYVCPVFKNCLFKDCNFDQVRTDGSDFDIVKFEGYMKSIIFYDKYSWRPNNFLNYILSKEKSKENTYHKVDFLRAKFDDVAFLGDIDLNEITLPVDEDIVLIENPWYVFSKMKDVVEREWTGENKRIALNFLNLEDIKKDRKNTIFLKHIDYKVLGKDYADKFYDLLQSVINSSK